MTNNYRGAFECHKCPGTGDPAEKRSCPMWWEMVAKNNQTGQQKIIKGCGYRMLPDLLTGVVQAANMASFTASETKNKVNGVHAAIQALGNTVEMASRNSSLGEEYKREIEYHSSSDEPNGEVERLGTSDVVAD